MLLQYLYGIIAVFLRVFCWPFSAQRVHPAFSLPSLALFCTYFAFCLPCTGNVYQNPLIFHFLLAVHCSWYVYVSALFLPIFAYFCLFCVCFSVFAIFFFFFRFSQFSRFFRCPRSPTLLPSRYFFVSCWLKFPCFVLSFSRRCPPACLSSVCRVLIPKIAKKTA